MWSSSKGGSPLGRKEFLAGAGGDLPAAGEVVGRRSLRVDSEVDPDQSRVPAMPLGRGFRARIFFSSSSAAVEHQWALGGQPAVRGAERGNRTEQAVLPPVGQVAQQPLGAEGWSGRVEAGVLRAVGHRFADSTATAEAAHEKS